MNIFVGNISRNATEDDLREVFSPYGNIASVSILKDRYTGQHRGFGFVEMPSKSEAEAAIAGLNGKELKGRALTVNEARPKTDNRAGGGPRGGGRDPW